MTNKMNWLAIIVAAVVAMGIGFLWYGVLFMDQWAAGNGIVYDETTKIMTKNGVEMPTSSLPMIVNTVAMFVYAIFMSWLTQKTGYTSFAKGAMLGAIIGLIMWLGIWVSNLFTFNPTVLSLGDGFYSFTLFTVIGAIVGGWRKK